MDTGIPLESHDRAAHERRREPVRSAVKVHWIWLVFAVILVAAPLLLSSSLAQTMLSQIGIAIIVCLAYNILLGQGGMLSFGHAVYSGLGAFLAMHTLDLVGRGDASVPVSLIPLVGGLGGLFCAVLLGFVTTRKSGTPFAMITLGIGELVWSMSLMLPEFFGGEGGISGNRIAGPPFLGITYGPQIQVYYLIAAYCFVCTGLMYAFTRTPLGRMLNAVRDNPQRVEFIGYDAKHVRFLAFTISGFFAGIAGGLAALNFELVTSEVVSGGRSGAYLLFVFLGGCGVFFGPIIGAILMVFALVLLSELTKAWLLYLGLAFVLMVLYAPGGISSLVQANLRLARQGGLRLIWPRYLLLLLAAVPLLFGAAVLIEMVYHLQQDTALGSGMRFVGIALDVRAPTDWAAVTVTLVVGACAFELARRAFIERWDSVQHTLSVNYPNPGAA